jgi:hypothetical protein
VLKDVSLPAAAVTVIDAVPVPDQPESVDVSVVVVVLSVCLDVVVYIRDRWMDGWMTCVCVYVYAAGRENVCMMDEWVFDLNPTCRYIWINGISPLPSPQKNKIHTHTHKHSWW